MHMMKTQPKQDDMMKFIELESSTDKILGLVDNRIEKNYVIETLSNIGTNLIFPFCGKRCFNTIMTQRNKKESIGADSEYATLQNWEKDGGEHNKSSIDVLIDYFTTEENTNKYFGGLDKDGRTSSNRKEAYHHHIRDLIKKENGKCFDCIFIYLKRTPSYKRYSFINRFR